MPQVSFSRVSLLLRCPWFRCSLCVPGLFVWRGSLGCRPRQVGYRDLKGMKFPAPYYMALALSVGVGYFLSMADGGYGTQLTCDVPDVVAVTAKAVNYVNTPGARFPNLP